ncbi:hypothetical protein F4861DRAFT_193492 [Xylaria intraflava]|nr:hypothetical protein F4861DRAFT_193492 [Xylaria intraflava]
MSMVPTLRSLGLGFGRGLGFFLFPFGLWGMEGTRRVGVRFSCYGGGDNTRFVPALFLFGSCPWGCYVSLFFFFFFVFLRCGFAGVCLWFFIFYVGSSWSDQPPLQRLPITRGRGG